LVVVEDSEISRKALEYALMMSQHRPTATYLFCVGHKKDYPQDEGKKLRGAVDEIVAWQHTFLNKGIVQAARSKKLDLKRVGVVHKRFSVGDFDKEVLKMAGNMTANSIILGIPSKEDADFNDGTFSIDPAVVSTIVKKAPCSVIALKALDPEFIA